jgi:segregation and condensation protein B
LKKLSAAAMETLLLAPAASNKGQVEAIRGVSADYAIQKLLEKN